MSPCAQRFSAVSLAAAVWLHALSCGGGAPAPRNQVDMRAARPTLRLVALTDLSGYLEPCGCQSRPLGGVDKAAARLRELGADGAPSVLVAAGDLLFHDAGQHAADLSPEVSAQQSWEAETLAQALGSMSLVAVAPGTADLDRGLDTLRNLAKRGGFSLLGAAGGRTDLLLRRGEVAIGLWGMTLRQRDDVQQALARAQQLTDALRGDGAEIVVGLVSADARAARQLAGATTGLDFLVHGGMDLAEVQPPERIGSTTLLRAAHQGHGLLVVELTRRGDGPFADRSAWTRQVDQQALQHRIAELVTKIAAWERDAHADRALIDEQRARLQRMRTALAALDTEVPAFGNTFAARFIDLDATTPSDPQIGALLDAHDRRVNDHNRVALAHVRTPAVAAGSAGYVGAERCGQCHSDALAWWQGHAHGRAYATLERLHKQWSLACVSCHVTGYGKPGGAAIVQNAGLTDVGCESCHGPGSLHVADPDVEDEKNVHREVPEALCVGCHNPEHSDRFAYAPYRAGLIAPGHGLPQAGAKP